MDRQFLPTPWALEPGGGDRGTAADLLPACQRPQTPWRKGENRKPVAERSRVEPPSERWQSDEPTRAAETAPPTSRRPGILVVDDDVAVRTLLNAVLWQQGFVVWLAGNGAQALELYLELPADIDLVLMDVNMPGLDGPQTFRALQRVNPAVRCCFMTGGGSLYTHEDLYKQGAVNVLRKPFRLPEVAQALWQLVDPVGSPAARRGPGGSLSELFLG